jgi:hypothetical protein
MILLLRITPLAMPRPVRKAATAQSGPFETSPASATMDWRAWQESNLRPAASKAESGLPREQQGFATACNYSGCDGLGFQAVAGFRTVHRGFCGQVADAADG